MTEKVSRKGKPSPGSGRRGADGAVGLIKRMVRVTPEQNEKIKRNGSVWVREAIQNYPEPQNKE